MTDEHGFIRTGFGRNPGMQVASAARGLVTLGIYHDNGDYHSETMTVAAARELGHALLQAAGADITTRQKRRRL